MRRLKKVIRKFLNHIAKYFVFIIIFIRLKIFRKKIYLIACMQKSGSTFITRKIACFPDFKQVHFSVGFERREQELSAWAIFQECLLNLNSHIIAQQHVKLSRMTSKIINQFQIQTIVLTRNIEDCLVSLRDHMHKESFEFPTGYADSKLLENAIKNGIDDHEFVSITNCSWYVQFFVSWSCYKDFFIKKKPIFIKYEDFFTMPNSR